MEYNLFDAPSAGASDREPMVEGAVLLRGKALAFEHDLFSALTTITERAPLRHMITPGGFTMSVANCGRAGWVTHRASYLYEAFDPENGRAVAGHAHGLPATGQRGRKRCRLPRLRPGRLSDQSIRARGVTYPAPGQEREGFRPPDRIGFAWSSGRLSIRRSKALRTRG
jgi:hypothetical protein